MDHERGSWGFYPHTGKYGGTNPQSMGVGGGLQDRVLQELHLWGSGMGTGVCGGGVRGRELGRGFAAGGRATSHGCRCLWQLNEMRKGFSTEPPEGTQPYPHLIPAPETHGACEAPRTVGEHICVV